MIRECLGVLGLKRICIVTVFILLLIGQVSIPGNSLPIDTTNQAQDLELVSSPWTPDEPLSDPYLHTEPLVVQNGTSEEFNSDYFYGTGEIDNYVNLTWTHVAGTELSFPTPYANTINCNDFMYISLPFEFEPFWEAAISVECLIETSGDFAIHEEYPAMFETFIAFRAPVDIVFKLNKNHPISDNYFLPTSEYSEHGIALDSSTCYQFTLRGYTHLDLAIGLSPTKYFNEFNDGGTIIHPWTFYNGSITFSIRAVHLGIFDDSYDAENTPPPSFIGINQERTLNASSDDVKVAPDGFVYTLVTEGKYTTDEAELVLIKWDSYANPIWSQRMASGQATGGITLAIPGDGFIYALGVFRDLWSNTAETEYRIAKWDYAGNLIWHRDVTSTLYYARDMTIDNQGNIYIIGYSRASAYESTGIVIKHNSECVHQWTKDWVAEDWFALDIATSPLGDIIIVGRDGYNDYWISRWDSNGNRSWMTFSDYTLLDVGPNGDLYGAGKNDNGFTVAKLDRFGQEIWSTTWGRYYHAAKLSNIDLVGFAIGQNDAAYVVAKARLADFVPLVVHFNASGDYRWNSTWNLGPIGDGVWTFYDNIGKSIDICDNNLAYVTGIALIESNRFACLVVIGDGVPVTPSDSPPSDYLTVGIAGIGIAGVLIALVIVYRKRQTKVGIM